MSTSSGVEALLSQLEGNARIQHEPTSDSKLIHSQLMQFMDVAKRKLHITMMSPQFRQRCFVVFRVFCVHREPAIRAQAFRLMRYFIIDDASIAQFMALNLDQFVVYALERDPKYVWERSQALKLITTIVNVNPALISRTLVQSVVALADTSAKEDIRRACLDTLRDLTLRNPRLLTTCNSVRTIVAAILDPDCGDVAGSLTLTLLYLMERPDTRQYLRLNTEVQTIFSIFTDTGSPNGRAKEGRRAAAHRALITMMRSWTGIICLASSPTALRSLVQILALPPEVEGGSWAKEAVFDLFFEILHVVEVDALASISKLDLWDAIGPNLLYSYVVFVIVAFIECGLVAVLTDLAMSEDTEYRSVAQSLLARLMRLSAELLPASYCSVLHSLPAVVQRATTNFDVDDEVGYRAANMLSDIHDMALTLEFTGGGYGANNNNANANTNTERKHTIEMKDATTNLSKQVSRRLKQQQQQQQQQQHGDARRARGSFLGIDLEQLAFHADPSSSYDHYIHVVEASRAPAGGVGGGGVGGGQAERLLDALRSEMDAEIDDVTLMSMLKKTNVIVVKDFKEWDFTEALELLNGPLCMDHAFEVAMNTKFFKRLCSFLRPDKGQFSIVPWTAANMIYVQVACQLFRVLIHSKSGCEYEPFVELVDSIMDALLIEVGAKKVVGGGDDAAAAVRGAIRPFSRHFATVTLSREYFTLLGILSTSVRGLAFFDKHQMYSNMYKLAERESKDYVTRLLIANLDYGANKKARTLLETWVKVGSRNLRKFAISHLRLLSKRHVAEFSQWGIGLLVAQLQYSGQPAAMPSVNAQQRHSLSAMDGEDDDVALMAMSVLDEACAADPSQMSLNTLIRKKPNFSLVGERANNLLTQILSTSVGVDYLNSINWIVPQMRRWHSGGGNRRYTACLEQALVSTLSGVPSGGGGSNNTSSSHNNNNNSNMNNHHLHTTSGNAGDPTKGTSSSSSSSSSSSKKSERGTGYVGPFGGHGGFRRVHRRLRSPADEYYFDRVHHLPWTVELVLETTKTGAKKGVRKVKMITDVFVQTVPTESEDEPLQTYVVAVVINQAGHSEPHAIFDNPKNAVNIRARLAVGADGDSDTVQTVTCSPEDRETFGGGGSGKAAPGSHIFCRDAVRWNFNVAPASTVAQESPGGMPAVPLERLQELNKLAGSAPVLSHMSEEELSQSNPLYKPPSAAAAAAGAASKANAPGVVHLVSVWFKVPLPSPPTASVTLAPHLYGSLANTPEGCLLLRSSGHFDEFINTIKRIPAETKKDDDDDDDQKKNNTSATAAATAAAAADMSSAALNLDIRAALWVVAVIGATDTGYELLHEANIVPLLAQQAVECPTLSMRGILMYVLGVISCSTGGRAALSALGWQFGPHRMSGVVLPARPGELLAVKPTPYVHSWMYEQTKKIGIRYVPLKSVEKSPAVPPPSSLAQLIMGHISNLGNGVTQKTSLQALRKYKSTNPSYFVSLDFLFAAMKLLSVYTFKLPARRFILHDMFGRVLWTQEAIDRVFNGKADELNEDELAKLDT